VFTVRSSVSDEESGLNGDSDGDDDNDDDGGSNISDDVARSKADNGSKMSSSCPPLSNASRF